METNEIRSYLETSSKRAALLSLTGILIVVAALIFSSVYLSLKIRDLSEAKKELEDKQAEVVKATSELDEKQKKLNATNTVCAEYLNIIDEKFPQAAKVALQQTVNQNPQARGIIEEVKKAPTPQTPKPNAAPVKTPSDKLKTAQTKEREGFQNLISGNYDAATAAFQASENAYPSYHNVYELAKILRENKSQMNDQAKKKQVFQTIVEKYAYGAPPDLFAKIKAEANQ